MPNPVEEIVQRQVDAYNRQDLNAFLDCYHDDAKLYRHPNVLNESGREEMRERYADRFADNPDLRATIMSRMVLGRFVIDQERATGLPGGRTLDAIAIYEVVEGKIANVWFIVN
jgi:hypothetical protein